MSEQDQIFIARQPILDRQSAIVAHELLFRSSAVARTAVITDSALASASTVVSAFASFDVDTLIGQTVGYFNVTREMLFSDVLEALPPDRVMIELLETIVCDEPIVRRCRELRERGYRVAIDDWELRDPRAHMLPEVDCVKVDLLAVPEKDLAWVVRTIRRHPVSLLAEKVEDAASHERCLKLGFDLFQGYYFARPTTFSSSKVDAGRSSVLRAMQKLSTDAGIDEIADIFKSNASLGVNLLRLVNSVGLTRGTKIENVNQALSMLGRRQVLRWLALLLFAGGDEASFGSALLETAAFRGRLMELLVARDEGPGAQDLRDRAFLAGMLSLADVLLGRSLEELAQELHVHEDIRAALQREPGGLGDLLSLAERLEQADFAGVEETLVRAGLDVPRLRRSQADAHQWVTALMAG